MAGPYHVGKAIGDTILTYVGGYIATAPIPITLATPIDWMPNTDEPSTSYPPNPYLLCPSLQLRLYTSEVSPGPPVAGTAHNATYRFSLWYYRRQTRGQSHQELLIQDLETIANPWTIDRLFPAQFSAITGFKPLRATSPGYTVYSEIRHEFDHPNLRISVGEVQVVLEGRITLC